MKRQIRINIHVTKQPMLDAYFKACPTYPTKTIESQVELLIDTYFAFLNNVTGDAFINTKKCFDPFYIRYYHHENPYQHIAATISHEHMHMILKKEHGVDVNYAFDNIAHKLEKQGYLGG